MQFYKEKVIQENPGKKCTAAKAEVCLMCSRNSQEISEYIGRGKECYRSWALKTIVNSLVFTLIETGSQDLLFRLFSIKTVSVILFLYMQALKFLF